MNLTPRIFCSLALICLLSNCVGIGLIYPTKDIYERKFKSEKEDVSRPYKIKKISESSEIWIYKDDGFKWAGVFLIVGVPIPLAIPVGKNKTYLFFENDLIVKQINTSTTYTTATCGFMFNTDVKAPGSVGCEIINGKNKTLYRYEFVK